MEGVWVSDPKIFPLVGGGGHHVYLGSCQPV